MSRVSLLALTALLGLAVALGASSAVASDSGQAVAVAAKKKCKKKKNHSAAAAKKKKCKKKIVVPVPPTVPPTPPAPKERVRLTFSEPSADLDLYVWDDSGNEASYFDDAIPNSSNSGNVEGGPETFTDALSPFTRSFAVGVCVYDADGSSDPIPFTLTYVDGSGTTHTYNLQTLNSHLGARAVGSHNYPTTGAGDPWFSDYNPEASAPGWCQTAAP